MRPTRILTMYRRKFVVAENCEPEHPKLTKRKVEREVLKEIPSQLQIEKTPEELNPDRGVQKDCFWLL